LLIDSTHRVWIVVAMVALGLGLVVYIPCALVAVQGPRGGSAMGIVYGSMGSALMLFAGLLGARKKVPVWRLGRATTWMRGHLWLGLLSFPFILFHSGFSLGAAPLTRTLMVLFIIVVVSGILGAVLQEFIPRVMTRRVPMETVYEEIDHVCEQLLEEATTSANDLCSALEGNLERANPQQRAEAASAGTMGGVTFASAIGVNEHFAATLRSFFDDEVKPYLVQHGGRGRVLADKERTSATFQQFRILCPQDYWPRLNDLENICEEKRELDRQRVLHRVLHGWLLVHIPASYALLLLGAVHAVLALRY
jgi:hypothetical protein